MRITVNNKLIRTNSSQSRKLYILSQASDQNGSCLPKEWQNLGKPVRQLSQPLAQLNPGRFISSSTQGGIDFEGLSPVKPYVDPKVSYVYGRSKKAYTYATLSQLIESKARNVPDTLAVSFHDQKISRTYKQLNEDIDQLVNIMVLELGLKRGDPVGLYSYNTYQSLLVYYACNKLGLILNPFNPSYKSHEMSHVLQKSNVRALFMPGFDSDQKSLNDHWNQVFHTDIISLQEAGKINNLRKIVLLDGHKDANQEATGKLTNTLGAEIEIWESLSTKQGKQLTEQQVLDSIASVSSDDPYCVYYTSGTTGAPKGATITQFNAINCIHLVFPNLYIYRPGNSGPLEPNVCVPLPLFHAYAGIAAAILPFVECMNAKLLFTGSKYNIASLIECIEQHKCNVLYATPTILIDLLTYIERHQTKSCSTLRTITSGGAKIMPETVRKSFELLPQLQDLRIIYGSSENGVIATMQQYDTPADKREISVGTPLDLCEIRIACPRTGATLPQGQPGEVQTRGFNTMAGYLNDRSRTDEVMTPSRWYKTGDMGILDSTGNLQIVGRIKELIIKGGENIYPAEVESVLHRHHDIEDAHVFGVPDPRLGEEVAVWVKLKQESRFKDEESLRKDILDYCKSKLTYFKVPKYVIFTEDFPLTAVKKVKKFEMRVKTVEMLGLSGD